jgi:ankyrin repeat protein
MGKIYLKNFLKSVLCKIGPLCAFILLFPSFTVFGGNLHDELISASKNGEVEKVKTMISKGADVNEKDSYGSTAIIYAVKSGNCDCVNILIKSGADTNIRNIEAWTPLLMATKAGNVAIVKSLLDNGADPNLKGLCGNWTALMRAVYDNHPEMVWRSK